jgi:hypothetical protein
MMTIGLALQRALDMEKQGCISPTALALTILMREFRNVVGEEVFQQFLKDVGETNDKVV